MNVERWAVIAASIFLFILPITHTVALRLLCLVVMLSVVAYAWWRNPPPSIPCKWPLLLWASLCWASLLWSIEPNYSFGELTNEVGYTIITYFAFYYLTRSQDDWRIWRTTLLTSLCAISIYAIYNYAKHGTWWTAGRVGDRNAYSTYVTLMMPFLILAITQAGIGLRKHQLSWLAVPLALISGYLTLNRIMWPTLIIVAVVFFVLYWQKTLIDKRSRRIGIAALLLICTLSAAQFWFVSHQKIVPVEGATTNVQQSFSSDPRLSIWSYGISRAAERPLTGYGYGRGILRQDFRDRFGNPLFWHGHNIFLNYTLEAGIVGSIALLVLFAAIAREFWKLYRSPNSAVWIYGLWGLTMLAAVMAKTMTDDIIIRENSLLFWAFTGMILGLGQRAKAPIAENHQRPSDQRLPQ